VCDTVTVLLGGIVLLAFEKIVVLFSGHRKTCIFTTAQISVYNCTNFFTTAQSVYNCTLRKPWQECCKFNFNTDCTAAVTGTGQRGGWQTSLCLRQHIYMCNMFSEIYNFNSFLFISLVYYLGASKVKRKKAKKMRSGSEDDFPSEASNVQLQNSVDSNAVLHSSEHHSASKTDKKHVQSPAKLEDGEVNAKKKRNKTLVETACGAANSEDDAASEVEEQHQKSNKKNVVSSNLHDCSQLQIDQRSESGSSAVVGELFTCILWFVTS